MKETQEESGNGNPTKPEIKIDVTKLQDIPDALDFYRQWTRPQSYQGLRFESLDDLANWLKENIGLSDENIQLIRDAVTKTKTDPNYPFLFYPTSVGELTEGSVEFKFDLKPISDLSEGQKT